LWSVISFPMLGSDRRVSQIVLRLEDVTFTAQMQLAQDVWPTATPEAPAAFSASPAGSPSPASTYAAHESKPSESALSPADSTAPRELPTSEQGSASLLLLATSDDERERLRLSFGEYGYRVSLAESERDALTICA
jgi:hypothetical protein